MPIENIDVFVAVVDAKSFSRAAHRLQMPTTTVSAKIARLEERLGITLIHRTTRRLHVTSEGRNYYHHCVRALREISDAEQELASAKVEPTGLLRITAPNDIIQRLLSPLVQRYLDLHLKTSVELIVTNQTLDLVAEGIDLAVRAGPLDDSSLIIQKFCSARLSLWATPGYLERKGTPSTPEDLKSHHLIRFGCSSKNSLLKSPSGQYVEQGITSRLTTDDFENLRSFVEGGYGIGILPDFFDYSLSNRQTLVRILPEFNSALGGIFFVYPSQRFVPLTVRCFISMAKGEKE